MSRTRLYLLVDRTEALRDCAVRGAAEAAEAAAAVVVARELPENEAAAAVV